MKIWKIGLTFLIAFLFQSGLVNIFSLWGRTPNVILALAIVYSFLYENKLYGFIFGAVFGAMFDICFCQAIGITAIPIALISFGIFLLDEIYIVKNAINLSIVSVISILLYSSLNWVMLRLAGNPVSYVKIMEYMPVSWAGTFIIILMAYLILIKDVIEKRKQDNKII